jgi:cellulose synthase/poly-beta-1,6-N-acetylglucosamine synthase-like glycosyltransferase
VPIEYNTSRKLGPAAPGHARPLIPCEEARLSALAILYLILALCLSIYGFNAFVLIYACLRHRRHRLAPPSLADYPTVTVQLPIYNEQHVARRLIDASAALDWPRDRLQVQVLDDSTDETSEVIRQRVEQHRQRGLDIVHLQRTERRGFKAGALNEGTASARGTYLALFDADFRPDPGFLRQTVPHLAADPGLGFVQARWGHLNDDFSGLTLAQAIALDGHFVVEHAARESAGWLTSFSGTGGVWRKSCLQACGGWDPLMLAEDVDLSYRAQLAGWRGLTLLDVVAPAELPVQLGAFMQQQFRWAKGNTQCLLKHGTALLCRPLSPLTRLEAYLHLSYYLAHPLMLAVMLITLPLVWYGLLDRWSLTFLSLATFGPPLLYVLGQRALYPNWWRRLRALPVLVCLGIGLAFNSTVAAAEAFLGIRSAFQRTPKFQIQGRKEPWQVRRYAADVKGLRWGEILLTLYALLTVLAAQMQGRAQAIPFVLLYAAGFGYVSILGILQSIRTARAARAQRQAASADLGSPWLDAK